MVFDPAGGLSLSQCGAMLKRGGMSLHTVPTFAKLIGCLLPSRHYLVFANPTPQALAGITEAAGQGKLVPAIGRVVPLGASAGAINAAYFAADPTRAGADGLEKLWCALRRRDVFPLNLRSVLGLLLRRDYLVGSHALRNLLERHLPYRRLEEAAIPIHIVASDMLSGNEVLLSSGSVIEAVLASTAIPGVFPPVQIDERLLVDGGVANNTPISTAIKLGATRIIVLPTGFACALKQVPKGAIGRAMHALNLLVSRQLVHDAERLAGSHIELRIVPSVCPLETSPYDYSTADTLIAQAKARTQQWLEEGGLDRVVVPMQLHEHHH